ncbi:hypothetical protein E3N88_30137 [Mikania micrantha]|uniref:Uncharacterized protein n=1 Tax=Mikania micrantha TaxID=192012 RepID=A0A5N6MNN3_9ASTR|nr:hypothetical protein E3N88_30137 [Mikania micrantha]
MASTLLHLLFPLCLLILPLARSTVSDATNQLSLHLDLTVYDDFDAIDGEDEDLLVSGSRVLHAPVGRITRAIVGGLQVRFILTPEVAPPLLVAAGEVPVNLRVLFAYRS